MENVIFIIAIVAFFLFVFVQGKISEYKQNKWFREKIRTAMGQLPTKNIKIERFARIPSYYQAHRAKDSIDDITWNDLGMDDVYRRMDYTYSGVGEEYLYHMLRTPGNAKELEALEQICRYYAEEEDARVKMQFLFHKLGNTGKYSLYDYLTYLDNLGELSNKVEICKNLLYVVFAGIAFVNFSLGATLLLLLVLWQLRTYFKQKNEMEPYITSIVFILRMLDTAKEIEKYGCDAAKEVLEKIKACRRELEKGRSFHFLFLYPGGKTGSGNPLDIIFDYVRMFFHIDIIVFRNVIKQMRQKSEQIDGLISSLGFLDAAISVCMYRASLQGKYTVPVFTDEKELKVTDAYHPLVKDAVVNSIVADKCVLITGSNASGKSTFLKTIALSALMAQTIHTVCAASYEAPVYSIYSSMALSDDIQTKESYYMVEIRSIKRIMDALKNSSRPVLAFVDEVLRGTNTVERIAASTQILKTIAEEGAICFAATHDIELTALLEKEFTNYHFEEQIVGDDVTFSYLLKEGKATTRNAIKLLKIMGYDEAVVGRAHEMAEAFLASGQWKTSLT